MTASNQKVAVHELLTLPRGKVDMWMATCSDIDPALSGRYRDQLLCEEERAAESTFHFARDRQQYLVTRALVRCVLSRYSDRLPADWRFGKTAHGRPTILCPSEEERELSFNISHCAGVVLVAVMNGGQLGIDTESYERGDDFIAIGQRCFTRGEVSALDCLPPAQRWQQYVRYWTLKEAYVKATGTGLATVLDSFGFQMPDVERIECRFNDPASAATDWHFSLLEPTATHVAALCCAGHGARAPHLLLRRMRPLVDEHFVDFTLLARSA
ncbi:4'-phosphopantetheinyl transferase superfamily protein [Pseudomonas sp. 681]|uniref:4'-phosphopantetheinyl transferase superfamily protein n=1 Tax=Pseudomonas fungipugnans TaxID=3024217 RepID=A0ABT6QK12_9PSED|nr:4'-phosphopantetheinyl transferase superfamily protein [Pseudomonas sp. 681]MDI2590639.1 4'-phosphopantetheinyl transferase superfamily protein [Pseudomonas sp. 681]